MLTSSHDELVANTGTTNLQRTEASIPSASEKSPTDRAIADSELVLALQMRSGARYLSELDGDNPAILVLRRVSVLLWSRIMMRRQSLPCPEGTFGEEHWRAANELPAFGALASELSPRQMTALQSFLQNGADLQLSELAPKDRRLLAGALARAERTLSQVAMGSKPEPIMARVKRNWRVISVTLLVLVLAAMGAVKLARMGLRPNLALHRPVQTSSVYGDFSNGERLVDSDPSNIGFHTQQEANHYAIIDLGRSMPIDEIVVHNRADCCQERAVPLIIEVSDDGKNYKQVAERLERFDRWIAKNLHARGRYVRLKVKAVTAFHLNEVEIF